MKKWWKNFINSDASETVFIILAFVAVFYTFEIKMFSISISKVIITFFRTCFITYNYFIITLSCTYIYVIWLTYSALST